MITLTNTSPSETAISASGLSIIVVTLKSMWRQMARMLRYSGVSEARQILVPCFTLYRIIRAPQAHQGEAQPAGK